MLSVSFLNVGWIDAYNILFKSYEDNIQYVILFEGRVGQYLDRDISSQTLDRDVNLLGSCMDMQEKLNRYRGGGKREEREKKEA